MRPRLTTFCLALICTLVVACTAEACPTCKAAIAENGGHLVRGYFWSIMFMMSMPFLIVAGLGGIFYMEVRRAQMRRAHADANGHGVASEAIAVSIGHTF